jgi:hypothetical protein
MEPELTEGAALLVAGHGSDERAAHTLGSIGEALLTASEGWRIKRLSPGAGERQAPTRANLKRMLDGLAELTTGVVVFACAGEIVGGVNGREPALVTGPNPALYPDEDTLPLRWIADRLDAARAGQLVAVISARAAADTNGASRWLDAMRTDGERDLVAIDAGERAAGIEALLAGVCGAALDPRTGTITLRSLGTHLVRSVRGIALQPSTASETITSPPPLGAMWDARAAAMTQSQAQTKPVVPAGADAKADEVELTGVVLPGRFRVDTELARGSFGVVYRARQLSVDRDVAVKIMHLGIDPSSDDGRLFVQEIQAVGRIEHPNVVRIYQADVTPDGRLFFAMELLAGLDLRQLLAADGLVPVERAVMLVSQLLHGLAAAHEAGLIHADIKPANAIVVERRARGDSRSDSNPGERVVLVDFGLARLKPQEGAVEALGGTPAYMAPEQLAGERIDARADVFSAALVLVSLVTGWQRASAEQLVPPLDGITDPTVRAALERALAIDPADRFQTASDFADALVGRTPRGDGTQLVRAPFRHLAAFTERDVGRLHGRDRDLAVLVEHALYRPATIYTAPSGTGKTSLLRAGLVPRLATLGARAVYFSCRAGDEATLAAAIAPGTTTLADAVRAHHAANRTRLVLVLDQVETSLETGGDLVEAALAQARSGDDPAGPRDVSVILSVREDFLARLVAVRDRADETAPIVRLGPLTPDGAREAIALPLGEARLAIAPDLLDALLADLERAAAAVGAELGWGRARAVYPPHLQLAGSALYEALGRGETELTLAHYRKLGGLDAIVGEHLDRVLDRELDEASAQVARDVFLALVTATQSRAVRSEAELLDAVGRHGRDKALEVLEALRTRGLMVRVRAASGEPAWELVHDSLVPRILAWVDRRDLARRRAIELVRYHLRRSRPDGPSLLSPAELREVKPHAAAIVELDAEWAKRDDAWKPSALVAASRRARRRQLGAIVVSAVAALAIAGFAAVSWYLQRARARREESLRDRDIGRFALELAPFDWDPTTLTAKDVPARDLPTLTWSLHEPAPEDEDAPGDPVAPHLFEHLDSSTGDVRLDHVEARGGRAFVIVRGRGRSGDACAPSVIPIRALPGYAKRNAPETLLRLRVPTCNASRADMIEVPAGPFIYGGPGEPPSTMPTPAERTMDLPAFAMDRTEVTNGQFAVFATMSAATGIRTPFYPSSAGLEDAGDPHHPVSGLIWDEARAFCLFFGKDLPTSPQWAKALRGALQDNPFPRRNHPWGAPRTPAPAALRDTGMGTMPVERWPDDRSPYGVIALAGNVQEWTRTVADGTDGALMVVRGGNAGETSTEDLFEFMAIENQRPVDERSFLVGVRCATP